MTTVATNHEQTLSAAAPLEVAVTPGFETFTRRLVPLAKEPRLTIQRRGNISLNESAHVALGSPSAVELLFDRDKQVMGLRAISSCEHAYTVRSAGGDGTAPFLVSALAFLKYFGVSRDTSMRWSTYMDGDVLCADLGTAGTPVTSNRARAAGTGMCRNRA